MFRIPVHNKRMLTRQWFGREE